MTNPFRGRGDDGRVSVFLAVAFLAAIILIGATFDGGGRLRAAQRANNLAAESARAAGQAIDAGPAVEGGVKRVNPAVAIAAANAYLTSAGATGTVTFNAARQEVIVTVTVRKDTAMLSLIGIPRYQVTGRATARLVTG